MQEKRKTVKERKLPLCTTCGKPFKYRIKRNWLVKLLYFWHPVKRYYCEHCAKFRNVHTTKNGK